MRLLRDRQPRRPLRRPAITRSGVAPCKRTLRPGVRGGKDTTVGQPLCLARVQVKNTSPLGMKRLMNLSRAAAGTIIAALLIPLGACDQGHMESIAVSSKPEPPPQLWEVAATDEARQGRPVHLCADGRLASGFIAITPEIAGRRCTQVGYTRGSPPSQSYRCQIDGQEFGVATDVSGHFPEEFTVYSTVTDIDAQRTVYSRSLHFNHLGLCPTGWKVGQATDQGGRRVFAAFIAGTNTPYHEQ